MTRLQEGDKVMELKTVDGIYTFYKKFKNAKMELLSNGTIYNCKVDKKRMVIVIEKYEGKNVDLPLGVLFHFKDSGIDILYFLSRKDNSPLSGIMKRAWEISRTFIGNVHARLSEALKIAWAEYNRAHLFDFCHNGGWMGAPYWLRGVS